MSYDIKTVVIVGSSGSGKTSIFNAMYKKNFRHASFAQGTYFTAKFDEDKTPICMTIFDTSSLEALFDIRRITYLTANVILLTFALDSRDSLRDLEQKWYPEVKYFAPEDVAVIVVGNKKDLRSDSEEIGNIRHEEGLAVAKKMNAHAYMECSALTGEGILDVFKCAARATIPKMPSSSSWCVIL